MRRWTRATTELAAITCAALVLPYDLVAGITFLVALIWLGHLAA